jgi:hypothetical protein
MASAKSILKDLCVQHNIKPETLLSKLSKGVEEAQASNRRKGSRGQVRCRRSWRGQRSEDIPYREDSIPIFASKGKGQFGNALSPFLLAVHPDLMRWATTDGKPGSARLPFPQKLELVWQSAKVAENERWADYFARRERIYSGKTPKRRYLDRDTAIAGACFGSEEDGLVQYVPSRVFYCTAYEEAVSALPHFCFLKGLVDNGFNLLILGPDGHPLEVSEGSVASAYADALLQFGHERVLVAMLRGERAWVDMPRCWPHRS